MNMSPERPDLLSGLVLSGYGGFYQVLLDQGGQLACKLRGRLRLQYDGVFAGDAVLARRLNDTEGVIEEVLPRRNRLPRPKVVNIDRAIIVMAWRTPDYDLGLLDRMLLVARYYQIEPVVCFNKIDLAADVAEVTALRKVYEAAGYPFIAVSAKSQQGLSELLSLLQGKKTVLAGPSGVGKSSLLNALIADYQAPTATVSKKLMRGRHTTRYVTMMPLAEGEGLVADSPGFSLLDLPEALTTAELLRYYDEFTPYGPCRFQGCLHDQEPDCAVKQAVAAGKIDHGRYQRYLRILQETRQLEDKHV